MIGLVCACIQVLAQFSTVVGTDFEWTLARAHAHTRAHRSIEEFALNCQFLVDCTNRRLQDDVSALIETDQVERVLADLDADGGDREWR
jgi:hypothetical protein